MTEDSFEEDREFLSKVRAGLEDGEAIGPESLRRIAAYRDRRHFGFGILGSSALLAATLTIAAIGWHAVSSSLNTNREAQLANVIALLQAADSEDGTSTDELDIENSTLAEALLAWQDAPSVL